MKKALKMLGGLLLATSSALASGTNSPVDLSDAATQAVAGGQSAITAGLIILGFISAIIVALSVFRRFRGR